jgi:hypothetical protein
MPQLWKTAFTVAAGQVPTTQTDFPVLLKPTDNRFNTTANGGHVANGNDIRPYADSTLTTALIYQLVPGTYNGSTGTFEMWVKVPSLSNGSVIYLGYGDTALTSDGSGNPFDSNFKRVYHFGNGTTLSAVDSSGNQDGTFVNTPTAAAGQIDGAASFASASTQYMTSSNTLNPITLTMEAWIKATSFPNAYNAIVSRVGAGYWSIYVKSNATIAMYLNCDGGTRSYDGAGAATLSTGTWYYIVLTYDDATGLNGYVNTVFDGSNNPGGNGNLITTASPLRIASDPGNASREWNGLIDEVRISDIYRSHDWRITCYNNQLAPTSFTMLGTETPAFVIPLTATVAAFTLTGNAAILNSSRLLIAQSQTYTFSGKAAALTVGAVPIYTGHVELELSVSAITQLVQAAVSAKLTIPISGTIRKMNGNFFDGVLRLMLSSSSAQNWTKNVVVIGTEVQFPIRHGGLPASARITPNDVLRPATTNYRAQFLNPAGTIVDEELFTITGTGFHFEITVP